MRKTTRILIIEDNLADFVLIEDLLLEGSSDIVIDHCDTFADSKIKIENGNKFDIVFLDLSLPDLKGKELITSILSICTDFPVVILTGYEDKKFAQECISIGAYDYLLKDEISAALLLRTINYNLERFKIRSDLNESLKSYHDLFEQSPIPMWVFDYQTFKFLRVNTAAILDYGYSEYEFLGMTIIDIRPPDDIEKVKKIIDTSKRDSYALKYFKGLFRHKHKNGNIRQVEIHSSTVLFQSNKAGLVLAHDVTEKLSYLNEMEKQNIKLKEIAWTQAHLVRSPLANIMGLCNLIALNHNQDPSLAAQIDLLQTSANQLDSVVRKIIENTESATKFNGS